MVNFEHVIAGWEEIWKIAQTLLPWNLISVTFKMLSKNKQKLEEILHRFRIFQALQAKGKIKN